MTSMATKLLAEVRQPGESMPTIANGHHRWAWALKDREQLRGPAEQYRPRDACPDLPSKSAVQTAMPCQWLQSCALEKSVAGGAVCRERVRELSSTPASDLQLVSLVASLQTSFSPLSPPSHPLLPLLSHGNLLFV